MLLPFRKLEREYQHMTNMVKPSIDFSISTVILAFIDSATCEYCMCYTVRFPVACHVSLLPASHFNFCHAQRDLLT